MNGVLRAHACVKQTHFQYRKARLRALGVSEGGTGPKMAEVIAEKRRAQREAFAKKQKEQKDEFINRVMHKEAELKRAEEEQVRAHEERMRQMQKQLSQVEQEVRSDSLLYATRSL